MNKQLKGLVLLGVATCVVGFSSCDPKKDKQVEGYKPIYMSQDDMQRISAEGPTNVVNPGKIFTHGTRLYINEVGVGVHIFDNSDPANPQNLAFVRVPGNYDVSVKDNMMYVDNVTDLIAINVGDVNNVTVESRLPDVFPIKRFPEEFGVEFECVDDSKGIVVGWEKAMLTDPKCYR